jgi:hypothetical protein
MAKCSAISPDKTHPAHGFKYVSIQTISDHLRTYCAEEGLDINLDVVEGEVILQLVNIDRPEDRIVSRWPVVPGDKGFAYSVKFPLIRTFLIGDGEENDEAVMATNSATASQAPRPASNGNGAAPAAGTRRPLGPCSQCAEEHINNRKGEPAQYWPPKYPGKPVQCDGFEGGVYMNHSPEREAVAAGVSEPSPDGDGALPWD